LIGLEHVRPGGGFIPTYRVAGKTNCNGAREEDLFAFLKNLCPGTTYTIGATEGFYWSPIKQADLTWNFEKFLINKDGKPVRRYNPATSPFDIQEDIEDLLAEIDEPDKLLHKVVRQRHLVKEKKHH